MGVGSCCIHRFAVQADGHRYADAAVEAGYRTTRGRGGSKVGSMTERLSEMMFSELCLYSGAYVYFERSLRALCSTRGDSFP